MKDEIRRKLVIDAEFYVASHRPHKMFTLDDVNNIAIGFAERCITEVTKELQEENKELKELIDKLKMCRNCKNSYQSEWQEPCRSCNDHSKWEFRR